MSVNYIGAEAKIRLGVDNVRRLWCIGLNPNKRPGISGYVLLIEDGGFNLYEASNCHLEETALKERFAKTQEII